MGKTGPQLLALEMEEGAVSQGMHVACRPGMGPGAASLSPELPRNAVLPHPALSPGKPSQTSGL